MCILCKHILFMQITQMNSTRVMQFEQCFLTNTIAQDVLLIQQRFSSKDIFSQKSTVKHYFMYTLLHMLGDVTILFKMCEQTFQFHHQEDHFFSFGYIAKIYNWFVHKLHTHVLMTILKKKSKQCFRSRNYIAICTSHLLIIQNYPQTLLHRRLDSRGI